MKSDIGRPVKIYSTLWYIQNKDINGTVNVGIGFTPEMSKYCSKKTVITDYIEFLEMYELKIDNGINIWCREMFKFIE